MKPSEARKARQRLLRAIDDHHALVYRVAYRVLGSREDAEDITQEVYLACIERPETLRSVRNLRSYLVRAALNRARSLARGRKSSQKREEVWAMEYARRRREGFSAKETGVREAIAALPEELRMPLVLYYEEGFKHREIAAVLGCPRGTVTDRLATGRARLRERLAQAGIVLPGKEVERLLGARHLPEIPLSPTLARRIREGVERKVAALPAAPAAASATLFSSAGVAIVLGLGLSFAGGFAVLAGAGRLGESSRAAYGEERLQADSRDPAARDSAAAALRWRRSLFRNGRNHAVTERSPEEGADSEDAGGEAAVVPARGFFGRVKDESGEPLEGVTVRYVAPHGTVRAETRSREDGSYALEVPIEEPAAVEGMVSATEYLRADIDHGLTEELSRSYQAQAYDDLTAGRGVSNGEQGDNGYWYTLDGLGYPGGDPQAWRDVLLASGSGLLASGSGDGTLEAFSDGFIAAAGKADSLSEEQPTREVDFVLYPASDVRGRVVDSTGDGVPSARVRVVGWLSDEEFPSAVLDVDTGPDGSFRFSSLPEGAYLVQAVAPGHVTLEAVVRTGVTARLDLQPAARLEVRAEDEGGEVKGIRMRLLDRGQLALERAGNGGESPTFEKVPAGEYILQVFRPDGELPTSEETLVLEGSEDLDLTVFLPLPCTVTGQILDSSGAPAPVGEVRFHPLDTTWIRGDGCASDRPEPGKAYSVGGLAPGRYLVTVTEREGHGLPLLHREVFVRPGERVARRDLVLDPERGSLELSFPDAPKAPDGDSAYGSPVSHATRVYRDDTGAPVLSKELGPGRHTLALPGGVYIVEVERAGHEPWRAASLWVPPLGTRRVDATLLPKTQPLPARAGSGQVSLRHACRLGSLLDLLEEALSGNVSCSRAVERSGILESAWLESFRGPVRELVERIEGIGPKPLLVRAGQGLFIDFPR